MNNRIADFGKRQKMAKKAIVFARVSSREQEEGYSIDAQIHRLKGYCERQNLSILKIYEIVESSTQGDRKHFLDMIKFVRKAREPIAIVADKVDRVQRSFKEYPLLDSLIQENKIELHFNTENYIIHKDSVSQERLMWSMGVIMAQSYVDNLRDNVKRSIDHKIRMGEWIALAPLGYLNTKNERMRGDIVVDQERAPIIVRMFQEYAKGIYTLSEVRSLSIKWGLKNRVGKKGDITISQTHQILRNPFYYGKMRIKGRLFDHKYPPLISKELYLQCQNVLNNWNKKPFKFGGKEFIFRGLLSCAISGRVVTADTKTKTYASGKKASWTYLRCFNPSEPFKPQWVREDGVVAQAAEVLSDVSLSSEQLDSLTKYLKELDLTDKDFFRRQGEELERRLNLSHRRLDSLMDLMLDGTIKKADYERKSEHLHEEIEKLESAIVDRKQFGNSNSKGLLSLLSFIEDLDKGFSSAPVSKKRQLINAVFSNLQLNGAKLCFHLRKPFDQFIKCTTLEDWRYLLNDLRTNEEMIDRINQMVTMFIQEDEW